MADTREPSLDPSDPAPGQPARGAVRRLYFEEWETWRSHYRRYFKIAARLLGIGFVLGFVFFTLRPDQERQALTTVLKALKDIPLDASPPVLALNLFAHNAWASFFAAAAGWIPFLCLPLFDPLLNGAVLGLLVSIARHQGMNVPVLVLTGILPHGIVELPAILYVTAVGIYVSVTLGKKILASLRSTDGGSPGERSGADGVQGDGVETREPAPAGLPSAGELAVRAARSFVLVVLPLLLLAAFIEAFLTPLLI